MKDALIVLAIGISVFLAFQYIQAIMGMFEWVFGLR
jgi:hypothetical protein